MKLFMCCVLLPFATVVLTAPIRARRENVLSFLNDALATTTEKTTPANTTAYRNPPSKPAEEHNSEDMSQMSEEESTDAFKDLDSHEITIPRVVEKGKAPMDVSSRLVRDQGSGKHSGPHGGNRASGERADLNSDEGVAADAQEADNLSGKQVIRSSGDRVTDRASPGTNVQRKATPGRVNGLNGMLAPGMLAPGRSRELLDWDSLEDRNGRPAPVGNRGDTDYDETREFMSSETHPIAPPELTPSSLSVPAKSQAS